MVAEHTSAGNRPVRRGISLRLRIAATSALVIVGALTAGAVGFVVLLDEQLSNAQAATAQQQAETIADQLSASGRIVPPPIDNGEVQVLRNGVIVASSEHDSPVDATPLRFTLDDAVVGRWDDNPAIIAAATADIDDVEHLVIVAQEIDDRDVIDGAVGVLLLVAVPLITLLVAVLVWFVVGRALRPVERLRSDVEAIGSDDLDRRVSGGSGVDEISRLATTMNHMLERLAAAQHERRRFVSDASHELRSPIASLRQHAQIALLHPGSTDLDTLAQVVDAESIRLTALVESLLDLARVDEKRMKHEAIDLDDVVLAEGVRQRAIGTVVVDTSGVSAVRIMGDPLLLGRAVRNLADNARRHAASTISLSCAREGNEVVLWVDDDGVGIAEADRERIFERFVRLDDARSSDLGGAGLGLAIVAGAALAHGGTASAHGSPLGGARLQLRLPGAG